MVRRGSAPGARRKAQGRIALQQPPRGRDDLRPGELVADAEVLPEAEAQVIGDAIDPAAGPTLLAQPEVGTTDVEPAGIDEHGLVVVGGDERHPEYRVSSQRSSTVSWRSG